MLKIVRRRQIVSEIMQRNPRAKCTIMRFKGLGEMNRFSFERLLWLLRQDVWCNCRI